MESIIFSGTFAFILDFDFAILMDENFAVAVSVACSAADIPVIPLTDLAFDSIRPTSDFCRMNPNKMKDQ